MMPSLYNSQLVVDTTVIRQNYASVHSSLGGACIIPVLKCDAYGIGAVPVARALSVMPGLAAFALAQASEAVALRGAGIDKPLMILGGVPSNALPAAVECRATLTLFSPEGAAAVAAEARRQHKTAYPVQLKIETGLNRIGARPGEELADLYNAVVGAGVLRVTGVFSHFADGEQQGSPQAERQLALFLQAVAQLEAAGLPPVLRHIAASGASEWFRDSLLDAARIGRRLYLDAPLLPGAAAPCGAIQEAFTWRSQAVHVKTVCAGETLGYGGAYRAERDMQVAVVCVGYGDGLLPELVKAGAPVLAGGRRGRLLATCMDQCFVDVTGLGCEAGAEIVFFGRAQTGESLPAQEVAGLIGHEGVYLTSKLAGRVERVYR